MTIDEARTLFHESGRALHGMLSDATYPLLSKTEGGWIEPAAAIPQVGSPADCRSRRA